MIVDTSALIAIARKEPSRERLLGRIASTSVRRLSAGTLIELNAVAIRGRAVSLAWIDDTVATFGLSIEPMTVEQARLGQDAYRRYGLGTGHPARLNFGDCFAYALAKETGEPLLFVGDDFVHTDIASAL